MNTIEWKKIKICSTYSVSNTGLVRNDTTGLILKPMYNTYGYLHVGLHYKGIKNIQTIHRLVAENFIINSESKSQVNHKNGIKTDNNVENLEWCTPKENINHAIKNKLKNPQCLQGENSGSAKLKEFQVLKIRELYKNKVKVSVLAKQFKVSPRNIRCIVAKKSWKHI